MFKEVFWEYSSDMGWMQREQLGGYHSSCLGMEPGMALGCRRRGIFKE